MNTSSHSKIHPNPIHQIASVVVLLGLIFGSLPGRATASAPEGVNDPVELETYLDGLFSQQMNAGPIAGITVAVVKDGQLILQKGYGYSNLDTRTPVDPAGTLFRIGSVTKLFTWSAVLQLFERSQLDLDADINTYLDFQIPSTFPEPITLKHLMSHTAGFEDRKYEMAVASQDQLQPLGAYLAGHIPARVRPVGQVSAYSNYGTDLAGYIVERISGMSYADYVEINILKPLGMDHTTSRQPLPPGLASNLSNGYRFQKGAIQPGFFEWLSTQPSGAISSTAADMARFMLACLDGGLYSQASTQQLMLTRLWAHDVRLTGFTYGFWELNFNGQRILYHAGDTLQFHSLLMLIPDQRLGFYFSYNTETAKNLWDTTLFAIMDHYFPQKESIPAPPTDFNTGASRFAGIYHIARSSYTTIEKVNDLLQEWVVVEASGDGALLFGSPLSPVKVRLAETQPLVFVESKIGVPLAFREDSQGKITHLIDLHLPAQTYEKVPWFANPWIHYVLLAVCSVLFLSVVLAALAGAVIRIFRKNSPLAQPGLARLTRWLMVFIAALNFAALVAFLLFFLDPNGFNVSIAFGQMATINIILAAWLVAAILSFCLVVLMALAWQRRYWGLVSRIHYTLVTLAGLGFVFFLSYWNLLGFNY